MKLKVEMTLTADTTQRFRLAAERLADMNLDRDGVLAAVVLLRISQNYERIAKEATLSNGDLPPDPSNPTT